MVVGPVRVELRSNLESSASDALLCDDAKSIFRVQRSVKGQLPSAVIAQSADIEDSFALQLFHDRVFDRPELLCPIATPHAVITGIEHLDEDPAERVCAIERRSSLEPEVHEDGRRRVVHRAGIEVPSVVWYFGRSHAGQMLERRG